MDRITRIAEATYPIHYQTDQARGIVRDCMNRRTMKRAQQKMLILRLTSAVQKQGEQILDELEKALNIDNKIPVYQESADYPEQIN